MTADKQLKAYIDRVLRLKAEQDTIGDDIREVYAEAKGEGYDKTVMGKIVAHLRKVEKSGADAVDEAETIFETYLSAYHRASGTVVATHTHEENFDRDTGEVLDINPRLAKQVVDGMRTKAGRAALIAAVDIMIDREEAGEGEVAGNASDLPTTSKSEQPLEGGDDEVAQPQYAATQQAGSPFSTSRPAAIPGKLYHEKTPFHPVKRPSYAACFPELTGKAFEDLKADINRNGVIEPIVRSFDTILDGFARYEIARSLGIEYPVLEYTGVDPLLDVIKLQRSSRDWTPLQEAKIARALAAEFPGRAAEIWAAFHLAEAPDGEVIAA